MKRRCPKDRYHIRIFLQEKSQFEKPVKFPAAGEGSYNKCEILRFRALLISNDLDNDNINGEIARERASEKQARQATTRNVIENRQREQSVKSAN